MTTIDPNTDIIVYAGQVTMQGYQDFTNALEQYRNTNARNVFFIPITVGGDPNAAYRMARALGHYYPDKVTMGIPSLCKSAGTLMCLGSSELVIADRGELGPLDIQLNSKDELLGMSSGLDIMQALSILQDTMNNAFKNYLYDLKFGGRLGTKTASDIASTMAIGLVAPIAQQIDPVKLGEHQRAMTIAIAYGERLNSKFKNTSSAQINQLLASYPAHGFVIDRKECKELFNSVRAPSSEESNIFAFVMRTLAMHGIDASSKNPATWVDGIQNVLNQIYPNTNSVTPQTNTMEAENAQPRQPAGEIPIRETNDNIQRRSGKNTKRKGRDSGENSQNSGNAV